MNMKTALPLAALALVGALVAGGCSNDNPSSPAQLGTMRVHMTDAPNENVEAVNLVITRVEAHRSGTDATSGWTVVSNETTNLDLILLRNGQTTLLASADVQAGTFDQVRLVLGTDNTVVVDGVTYPLTVPSGQTSGVKVFGTFTVPAGGTQDILLDWDAARSIHVTGEGTWMLAPVIRFEVMPASG